MHNNNDIDYKKLDYPMGIQCKNCCMLKDLKCTRISNTNSKKVGVCWMESGEGEY